MKESWYDAKRRTEQATRRLYSTKRWQGIRAEQLGREPLCRFCSKPTRPVAATVCDHVEPHRGNVERFWAGPFQSLCSTCHDGAKQAQEVRGHVIGVTVEGRPKDPMHPWNRAR